MGRILGTRVPPLFPEAGPICAMLYGEAPGPRGADQSGIPFWGDRAGKLVYRTLERIGAVKVPAKAWDFWDGACLRKLGLVPTIQEVVLGNAYPNCPTDDGEHFRAPTNRELSSSTNLRRLQAELHQAASQCSNRLYVIALGKRATWLFQQLQDKPLFDFHVLPHPSAQGLLQAAPNKGRDMKLADLEQTWEQHLLDILVSAHCKPKRA